ncbi:MAG: hypothetical protein WCC58_07945, partial [Burkholderiales bacterium]
ILFPSLRLISICLQAIWHINEKNLSNFHSGSREIVGIDLDQVFHILLQLGMPTRHGKKR